MPESNKRKFTIYAGDTFYDKVEAVYRSDNCQSKNEFILKAVEFYLSYLSAQDGLNAYAPILSTVIQASVKDCEEHLSRNLFKLAVGQAKVANLLAVINELDDDTLRKLHIKCVDEVRKTNGIIRYEKAVQYQQG